MKRLIYIIAVFLVGVFAGFILDVLIRNSSVDGAILTQPVEIFNAAGQKVAVIYQGAYLSRDKITSDFRFLFSLQGVGYQQHEKIETYYRGSIIAGEQGVEIREKIGEK